MSTMSDQDLEMRELGRRTFDMIKASVNRFIDATDDAQRDEATDQIYRDVLSVLTRTNWHELNAKPDTISRQYQLLLGTGGPAMRIVGEIDCYGQPETAVLELQNWFTPWIPYHAADESVLLEFAQFFYFGE